jgi:hypothetical protein
VRIMSPTVLPRRYARRPRRTLRSHDCQRVSSKLSIQKFLKRYLGRKEAAAYATHQKFLKVAGFLVQPRPPGASLVDVGLGSPISRIVPSILGRGGTGWTRSKQEQLDYRVNSMVSKS